MADKTPHVLLTGGGSGIGLTVLGRLLKEYKASAVVLTLCETPELSALVEEHGDKLVPVYGDVCDDKTIDKAVATMAKHFSYITHLVSCVGTMLPVQTIRDVPVESFRRIFDINFFSVFSLVQKSLPLLDKGKAVMTPSKPGVLIVTSGVDLDVYYRGWTGYCSSKAALTRFIHLLAHEEPDLAVYGALPLVTKSPMVDMIFAGKYDSVMLPYERERFNTWAKTDMIEPPEYIADSIVHAVMGELTPESPQVERNVCGALFVGSLYQQRKKD